MQSTTIDPEISLGDLVRQNPERACILEANHLDYCCGGDASLAQACEQAGLEIASVLDQLAELDRRSSQGGSSLGEQEDFESAGELIDFIVEQHHVYLRDELESLGGLVDKVERVHGDAHPELHELANAFHGLARELRSHLAQEEEWVFPAIRQIDEGDVSDEKRRALVELLDDLDRDHDHAAAQLRKIRQLTDDYSVPRDACTSYRNMLARLERVASDTHMHVHRENNILFPLVREQLG